MSRVSSDDQNDQGINKVRQVCQFLVDKY